MNERRALQSLIRNGAGCDGGLSKWTCCNVSLCVKIHWFYSVIYVIVYVEKRKPSVVLFELMTLCM